MEQSTQRYSAPFLVIAAVFATTLVVSNIIAVKIAGFAGLTISVSFVLFPISYIFGDILTEVYGYAAARRVIWLGFACNVLAVIAIWLGQILPSASFWENQAAYETILGATPRLLVSSFIAYLFGEFLNSFVLAKLKVATAGRWLWLRTITSTVVGQGVDSVIFITLAFVGTMAGGDLARTIVTQWLAKSAYEALATPLTYAAVGYLKRLEGVDTYDRDTNFNPLSV
jgi:uncharacterized integral membrane protein (TIGR00697 family)